MSDPLKNLLRLARFQGWSTARLEAEIKTLLHLEGVDDQPAVTPDQIAGPPAA
jgi:hypothetical protein